MKSQLVALFTLVFSLFFNPSFGQSMGETQKYIKKKARLCMAIKTTSGTKQPCTTVKFNECEVQIEFGLYAKYRFSAADESYYSDGRNFGGSWNDSYKYNKFVDNRAVGNPIMQSGANSNCADKLEAAFDHYKKLCEEDDELF